MCVDGFYFFIHVSIMEECLLVLAAVVSNPSPEKPKISSSVSHRPPVSLAVCLAMQTLIIPGTAILPLTAPGPHTTHSFR